MTAEMQAAIAQMQTKPRQLPNIWQNANGTFSHHMDASCQWTELAACEMDLRLSQEWAR